MPVDTMTVSDHLKWGQLIKAWATQKPLPESTRPLPVPKTLEELKAQAEAIGLVIHIPTYIKYLKVVPSSKDTFTLKIPSGQLIEEIEQDFKAGRAYPLPAFYDDLYGHPASIPASQKINLQSMRIGDYSIGMCA
jgi:hypothetical protein